MAKVVICIHGRANKPEPATLRKWWKTSVEEGLKEIVAASLGATPFEMAYYADIYFVGGPVPDSENDEPYRKAKKGAIKTYREGVFDRLRQLGGSWLDDPADWLEEHSHLYSALGRSVAKKLLRDLGEYYSDQAVRTKVNGRLRALLVEHRHNEIILVSHSMGAIVAYEVLRDLGRSSDYRGFVLEHFITLGAPLGLTVVKGNTVGTHGRLRTPSCVRGSWVNFSDPQDFVALDAHLADDYLPNSFGIQVRDELVSNDYPGNEHKSYGYLRTPEFSQHLAALL